MNKGKIISLMSVMVLSVVHINHIKMIKLKMMLAFKLKKNVISLSISKHCFLSARFLINIKLKPEINDIDPTYKKAAD